LLNSIKINQICIDAGVGCWIGGMMENDIGKGICVDLCALPNMSYPGDVAPADKKMKYSFVKQPLTYSSPFKMLPRKNAEDLIEPDETRLKDFIVRVDHFE
jgi:L-alanine-DL-glutamate epimerase-like enolase superfamily enzyme